MKTALVTGASSGIGLAISRELSKDYKVYGLIRSLESIKQISKNQTDCISFEPIVCNLSGNIKELKTLPIKDVDILINCAGVGYYGLHESLTPENISELVQVNLTAPMILANLCLPALKNNKGILINISSVTANGVNTHGCAYGASKAGLSSFTKSLFAEVRKHGVRCIDIKPDMTDTNLYRNANFGVSENSDAFLTAQEVAKACVYCIHTSGITELTIQPQKHQIKKL